MLAGDRYAGERRWLLVSTTSGAGVGGQEGVWRPGKLAAADQADRRAGQGRDQPGGLGELGRPRTAGGFAPGPVCGDGDKITRGPGQLQVLGRQVHLARRRWNQRGDPVAAVAIAAASCRLHWSPARRPRVLTGYRAGR